MKNFGLKEVYLHCMNVIHTQYVYTNCTFGEGDFNEGHSLAVGGVALPYCSPCKRLWKLGSWSRRIGYVSASGDAKIVQEGNSN